LPVSTQQIIDALSHPQSWPAGGLTYSLPGAGASWGDYGAGDEPSNPDYGVLNPVQVSAFREAMAAWDQLIVPTVTEVGDAAPGQIRIAFSDLQDHRASSPDTHGYTFLGAGSGRAGDIWLDEALKGSRFTPGTDDGWTLLHEIGHALGLRHPFGDAAALPAEYDNLRYTVMAYEPPVDGVLLTGRTSAQGVGLDASYVRPSTPMLFDVVAIQAKYGAAEAAVGSSTYTFDESRPILQTIYDTGGVDTFDLSANSRGSIVDLTPGEFSSIGYWSGSAQAAYWASALAAPWSLGWLNQQFAKAEVYTWSRNVATAPGTVIENVIGAAGGDTINGNAAANQVFGRAGADSISGGDGEDYLRGEDGNDTVAGGGAFDDIHGNLGDDVAFGGEGNDWVVGGKDNDRLSGEGGDDIVYGNLGEDTCDGGAGADLVRGGQANDVLFGRDGDDWLSGDRGDDTIAGGGGADIFHGSQDAGIDRVLDFSLSEGDRVQLDPGTTYSLRQAGADTIIDMGGGHQIVLVGVSLTSLGGAWIF
jgi:serralysin